VQQAIGKERSPIAKWMLRASALAVSLLVVVGVARWRRSSQAPKAVEYQSAVVETRDLAAVVAATGTIQPVSQVEVSSVISGTVESVLVDFNDRVREGQLLAQLDSKQQRAAVTQARAQLAARRADKLNADAQALEAEQTYERTKALLEKGLKPKRALESAQSARARARAAQASAKAQIALARSSLESAEIHLERHRIVSPIDGTVLLRRAEPGQTVAATLNPPVLFELAADLKLMEVRVDIDEADIGQIAEEQQATFTVDAYPERTFSAVVESVRNTANIIDGVVTYRALLRVDNADRALRPGMTATVAIVTREKRGVLAVPNAALRFTPPDRIATQDGPNPAALFGSGTARSSENHAAEERTGPVVWIHNDKGPRAVPVTTGISDGTLTEIVSGELSQGMEVLVDVLSR
jgi:HlyD family secretion protein